MKVVKKFTTFEELKACEGKKVNNASSFKMHNDFKKVIMDIRSIKILKATPTKPNQ